MTHSMTISQFARAAGVGVETVRFYHRRGLLPIPQTTHGSYRQYDDALLQQLRFIKRAQLGGFTLKEIKELLHCDPLIHRQQIYNVAKARLTLLSDHIKQLITIHNALEQMVQHCEERSPDMPCPIVEALASTLDDDAIHAT